MTSNKNTYDRRFAAVCTPADRDAINAACEAVSSSYENMFSLPALYEDDPDPVVQGDGSLDWSGTTIRAYSTGIVMTSKPMRRNLSDAVSPWLTSANWKEVDSRGDRFPDAYPLFLSEYQLREAFNFTQATGALRGRGGLPSQVLGVDQQNAVLLNQWEDLEEARNVHLDGTGQRMTADFPGVYEVALRMSWDNPDSDTINFQLALDTTWIGLAASQSDEFMQGTFSGLSIDTATQKLGLGVWANEPGVEFKLRSGWLGIKRTA